MTIIGKLWDGDRRITTTVSLLIKVRFEYFSDITTRYLQVTVERFKNLLANKDGGKTVIYLRIV